MMFESQIGFGLAMSSLALGWRTPSSRREPTARLTRIERVSGGLLKMKGSDRNGVGRSVQTPLIIVKIWGLARSKNAPSIQRADLVGLTHEKLQNGERWPRLFLRHPTHHPCRSCARRTRGHSARGDGYSAGSRLHQDRGHAGGYRLLYAVAAAGSLRGLWLFAIPGGCRRFGDCGNSLRRTGRSWLRWAARTMCNWRAWWHC